jgi:L-alanine-DL-glutamate epimerase-like enolase superfamily enzyme
VIRVRQLLGRLFASGGPKQKSKDQNNLQNFVLNLSFRSSIPGIEPTIFVLKSRRSDRLAKSTYLLQISHRSYGFDVLKQKQAVDERVHELDHVIAFRERFGELPQSGPVFRKRHRDRR